MAEQMYNLGGKPTPYSQLPDSVKRALAKRAAQTTQQTKPSNTVSYGTDKKPAPTPVKAPVQKESGAITRASGKTSYRGLSAREALREREQLYKQGYHNLTPLQYGGSNVSAAPGTPKRKNAKGYAAALKKDQAAGYYTPASKGVVGTRGATFDQRMDVMYDYTVKDPRTGETKTFDTQKEAIDYANRNPLESKEIVTGEKYTVVGNNGKVRTFKSLAKAEKYAATQTKTVGSYIGFSPSGEPYQGAPKPEYVEVKYPQPGDKYVIVNPLTGSIKETTITQKPLSSTGERLEVLGKWLEEQQIKAVEADKPKYYRGAYGEVKKVGGTGLVPMGIEVLKDIVATGATIENLLWKGEAAVRGGQQKTRDAYVPETATGVLVQSAIEKKSLPEIWKTGAEYEKKFGRGTVLAGGAALLIPVPGLKGLNIVKSVKASPTVSKILAPVQKALTPVASKLKVPKIRNLIAETQEVLVTAQQKRVVKKYAETRAGEGVFGIKKISKNVWAIERGVEEVTKPVSPGLKTVITGFTKKGKELLPVYAKKPKSVVTPKPGIQSKVPLTIVEFGKEYVKKGKSLTPSTPKFTPAPKLKYPVLAKVKRVAQPKPITKQIKNALGIGKVKPKKAKVKGAKPKQIKSKKITVAEVTDFMAVERGQYQTVGTKRALVTAADPDFARQANKLKLEKISETGYAGRMTKDLLEAEQLGLVRLTAVGKSIPMKLAKSGQIEAFVGKKAQITKVFELGKGGLGRAKEFPFSVKFVSKGKPTQVGGLVQIGKFSKAKVSKTPFEGVGSKDFDRYLEAVGLGERSKTRRSITPFDTTPIPTGLGRAGGGAKVVLDETIKKNILGSFAKTETKQTPNVITSAITGATSKVKKPSLAGASITIVEPEAADYIRLESPGARERRRRRNNIVIETEEVYTSLEFPQEVTLKETPRLTARGILSSSINFGSRTKAVLLGGTVTRLDSKLKLDVVPKIKNDVLTKQVSKQVLRNDQFRVQLPKQITRPVQKAITKVITTPKLKIDTPPEITFKLKEFTTKPPVTKVPPFFITPDVKGRRKSRGKKKKPTFAADFLGQASEFSVFGLSGSRGDITYGRERTARLSALDFRKARRVKSYENPERIKIKKPKKRKTGDFGSKRNQNFMNLKNTKKALYGSGKKKVKF